jgi:chemotaxis protein MotB
MRNDYYTNSKDYINRWVVSYADFVTMLLALFMFMYAVLRIDNQKLTQNTVENVTKYQVNQDLISFKKDELKKILKDNISDSDSVKLLNTPKGVIIRLNNKLLFDEGSAVIKKDSQKIINEIIKVLTKIDNPVIIEGHTDSIPIKNVKYSSNWELSTARATNIIAYISKIENISPKRLCAVGYGEYMPIADNTTISGRILNRRVDIIVLDK